jgi:syntaxin 8
MLQTQQFIIQGLFISNLVGLYQDLTRITKEQDQHLDNLSHSINRQHHISLQINDELDVHHGLLQDLDADIDRTQGRLSNARKKLDRVARGVKNNSWFPFAVVMLGAQLK